LLLRRYHGKLLINKVLSFKFYFLDSLPLRRYRFIFKTEFFHMDFSGDIQNGLWIRSYKETGGDESLPVFLFL